MIAIAIYLSLSAFSAAVAQSKGVHLVPKGPSGGHAAEEPRRLSASNKTNGRSVPKSPASPPVASADPAVTKSLDSLLRPAFKDDEPGIVVFVARKGQVIYEKAYGSANLEQQVPLKPDMVFRIGSISKQFTAIAILQLVEQGRLQLSDSVQQYLKDFPSKGHTITIEQLLTHTAGLPDYMQIDHPDHFIMRHDVSPQFIIDHFKQAPLQFTPGTRFAYSNSGYVLLANIVEKVSGKPYHDYLQKEVLKKAGLEHTYYAKEEAVVPGRVNGYTRDAGYYQNTYYQTLSIGYGAGDLLSTAQDLYKWTAALWAYKLVKKETLDKAFTAHRLPNGQSTGYGYGWYVNDRFGTRCIKHEGSVSGFISSETYFPDQDLFIATLTNVKSGEDRTSFSDERFMLFGQIPRLVLSSTMPPAVPVPEAIQLSYVGKYKIQNGQKVIAVKRIGDLLYLVDGLNFQLHPLTVTRFSLYDVPMETAIEFTKDGAGKVTGLTAIQAGGEFKWVKVE